MAPTCDNKIATTKTLKPLHITHRLDKVPVILRKTYKYIHSTNLTYLRSKKRALYFTRLQSRDPWLLLSR